LLSYEAVTSLALVLVVAGPLALTAAQASHTGQRLKAQRALVLHAEAACAAAVSGSPAPVARAGLTVRVTRTETTSVPPAREGEPPAAFVVAGLVTLTCTATDRAGRSVALTTLAPAPDPANPSLGTQP
jgi:hypothetical protein